MPNRIPDEKSAQIKRFVYKKADDFGYSTRSRSENNQFLDELVNNTDIGGVLRDYLPKEKVRTYIKDAILNAYAKQITQNALDRVSPIETIQRIYRVSSSVIQQCTGKDARVTVLRSDDGRIFVVSGGTVLKWETALRKALELIAKETRLTIDGKTPAICLHLVTTNNSLTVADKNHIMTALGAVGVQVIFCDD